MTYHYYKVKFGKENYERYIIFSDLLKRTLKKDRSWLDARRKFGPGDFREVKINLDKVEAFEKEKKISKQEYEVITGKQEVEE